MISSRRLRLRLGHVIGLGTVILSCWTGTFESQSWWSLKRDWHVRLDDTKISREKSGSVATPCYFSFLSKAVDESETTNWLWWFVRYTSSIISLRDISGTVLSVHTNVCNKHRNSFKATGIISLQTKPSTELTSNHEPSCYGDCGPCPCFRLTQRLSRYYF